METPWLHIAETYAQDVHRRRIPVCRLLRLAAKRFLDDLKKSRRKRPPKSFPWVYDEKKAARVCRFIQLLPHVKGEQARRRERVSLEPWQVFIICNLFGWVHHETGNRRFLYAYIEVPRKNGKSFLAAAIGLYMLIADKEPGAEVYSAATSEKQAREVFDAAKGMIDFLPDLRKKGVTAYRSIIHHHKSKSKFEPLPAIPRDGANGHCIIIDEYHQWDSSALYDALIGGTVSRAQPLTLIITTAGFSIDSPCYRHRQDIQKILEGEAKGERTFAAIWSIDSDDDWKDPKVIRKANPNLDISTTEENILAIREKALRDPQAEYLYKTKFLNLWVKARHGLFNAAQWLTVGSPSLTLDNLPEGQWVIGADLASKQDLSAIVAVAKIEETLHVWSHFYLPQAAADEQAERIPYTELAALGHCTITPGAITDYSHIERDIKQLAATLKTKDIVFDPHNASQIMIALRNNKLNPIEIRTTMGHHTEPINELKALLTAGQVIHSSNPIMDAHMASVEGHYSTDLERVRPSRPNVQVKIDGVIALLNGMSRILTEQPKPESPYKERGIRVI